MFDTQIFDSILDGGIDPNDLPAEFEYFSTHVQKDEIENITDPDKMARKQKLLRIFNEIAAREIPTESTVWGKSRWGMGKWGTGKLFPHLLINNSKNTEDALIGETAINNNLVLVTVDDKFMKRVVKNGGTAITFEQFKKDYMRSKQ